MQRHKNRPILVDFLALSSTGKSKHSQELLKYLQDKGYSSATLSYRELRKRKVHSMVYMRHSLSAIAKALFLGVQFVVLTFRTSKLTEVLRLFKWSQQLMTYKRRIHSDELSHYDFIILDPSLSSRLILFYRHCDDISFLKVLTLLEREKFLPDVVVNIEAHIDIVKERRKARKSHTKPASDSAIFSIKKAFTKLERPGSSVNFLTVDYNDFSKLEDNIQRIGEICIAAQRG